MKFDYTKKYYCGLEGLSEAKINTLYEFVNPHYTYDFRGPDVGRYCIGYQGERFGCWEISYPKGSNWIELTYGEFIQLIEGYEGVIRVGDHKVEFLDSSIKVGCTEVSHELLREIHNRAFKK